MAYAGHISGPAKSALISIRQPTWFGCEEDDYRFDIAHHEKSEALGVVDPVNVDEQGRPYIAWGNGNPDKREYLEGQLDSIFGKHPEWLSDPERTLKTTTPDELARYQARLAA